MYHTEGSPRPVIPGSSLKGSIRTALLNDLLDKLSDKDHDSYRDELKNESHSDKYDAKLQEKLLNYRNIKADPLRAISLSDCMFKASGTQLVGGLKIAAFDKQNESLEAVGTQIQAEVIRGVLLGGTVSSELQAGIDADLQGIPFPLDRWNPKPPERIKKISINDIRDACNVFYWDEFQNEYKSHYQNVNDGTETLIVELKNRLEAARNTEGQFIIRVGRWSQVEFVTFEESFRRPAAKKDRKTGKPLWGGTRTLFDYDGKYVPMGWCVLSING
jgi:CRISPR-associated protein Csm5